MVEEIKVVVLGPLCAIAVGLIIVDEKAASFVVVSIMTVTGFSTVEDDVFAADASEVCTAFSAVGETVVASSIKMSSFFKSKHMEIMKFRN